MRKNIGLESKQMVSSLIEEEEEKKEEEKKEESKVPFNSNKRSSIGIRGTQSQISSKRKSKKLERCIICMEEMTGKKKSKLNSCNHEFCFDCINKWATEKSNKCPVCKTRFTEIHCKDEKTNQPVVTKIDHKDLGDSESESNPACVICDLECEGPSTSYTCMTCVGFNNLLDGKFVHIECI
jgi:hypothetical protein